MDARLSAPGSGCSAPCLLCMTPSRHWSSLSILLCPLTPSLLCQLCWTDPGWRFFSLLLSSRFIMLERSEILLGKVWGKSWDLQLLWFSSWDFSLSVLWCLFWVLRFVLYFFQLLSWDVRWCIHSFRWQGRRNVNSSRVCFWFEVLCFIETVLYWLVFIWMTIFWRWWGYLWSHQAPGSRVVFFRQLRRSF